jgi:hypothetical protein
MTGKPLATSGGKRGFDGEPVVRSATQGKVTLFAFSRTLERDEPVDAPIHMVISRYYHADDHRQAR